MAQGFSTAGIVNKMPTQFTMQNMITLPHTRTEKMNVKVMEKRGNIHKSV